MNTDHSPGSGKTQILEGFRPFHRYILEFIASNTDKYYSEPST